MPRNYVDNAYNRRLGRVGMPLRSMVVSRGSSGGGYCGTGYSGSTSGYSSTKTYVDNSYNRSIGRVGMQHGTAVVSRSSASAGSSGYSGSPKTYVDNSYNRSIGRVGMEHGTAVVSKSSSSTSSRASSGFGASPKTYVDNAYNRSQGRVGLDHGTAVVSKSASAASRSGSSTYVDNDLNRRLGRVGLQKGTAVVSKTASSFSTSSQGGYKDNDFNRRLGRVGLPLGSMVVSRSKSSTSEPRKTSQRWKPSRDLLDRYFANPYDDMDIDCDVLEEEITQQVVDLINRMEQVRLWQEKSNTNRQPSTSRSLIQSYQGERINFDELDLKEKIGQGGFGDVFFAEWRESVVAVKKLRVQRVSQKRLRDFWSEISVFCMLEHPNIVKFIGACVVTPKIAIVMEYMEKSLFQKIHIEDCDISEKEKMLIITQVVNGLDYLHGNGIAHCDVKSQNVLLNEEATGHYIAKITDFGLSIMKSDADTSTTKSGQVQFLGTPRYSAPEVLRGDILGRKAMMKSDVYSLGLVLYEIICEEEPFSGYNQIQLVRYVGNGAMIPEIGADINPFVAQEVTKCWERNPLNRPSTTDMLDNMYSSMYLYEL